MNKNLSTELYRRHGSNFIPGDIRHRSLHSLLWDIETELGENTTPGALYPEYVQHPISGETQLSLLLLGQDQPGYQPTNVFFKPGLTREQALPVAQEISRELWGYLAGPDYNRIVGSTFK